MKRYLLLLTLVFSQAASAQDGYKESVKLDLSSTDLITGETLHFSAFIHDEQSGKLSDLSSLLYLELVDHNMIPRHQTKINLKEGRGAGSIYLRNDLESGLYHLITYTRWNKNEGEYFHTPILIINPYKELAYSLPLDSGKIDSRKNLQSFNTLDEVQLLFNDVEAASLAVAVIRKSTFQRNSGMSNQKLMDGSKKSAYPLLPEYNFGIIEGRIKAQENLNKAADKRIVFSYQDQYIQLSDAITDDNGAFSIPYIPDGYSSGFGYLSMDSLEHFQLEVGSEFYMEYSNLPSATYDSTENWRDDLKQRSINNQIMRAYENRDAEKDQGDPFYTTRTAKVYVLDEYERFRTMRDTFLELMLEIFVRKDVKSNELRIRASSIDSEIEANTPLILLDGLIVDSKEILELSPYLVERVEIVTEPYFTQSMGYSGVLSVHTFKGDFGGSTPKGTPLNYVSTQKAYKPILPLDNTKVRAPHYEYILLWSPIVQHSGGDMEVSFITSEFEGVYEARIFGISEDGGLISLHKEFEIQSSSSSAND